MTSKEIRSAAYDVRTEYKQYKRNLKETYVEQIESLLVDAEYPEKTRIVKDKSSHARLKVKSKDGSKFVIEIKAMLQIGYDKRDIPSLLEVSKVALVPVYAESIKEGWDGSICVGTFEPQVAFEWYRNLEGVIVSSDNAPDVLKLLVSFIKSNDFHNDFVEERAVRHDTYVR